MANDELKISNKRPSQRCFKPQTILDGVHERLRLLFDKPEHKDIQETIYTYAEWITVPYSSWAIPNDGAARHVVKTLEAGEKLDRDVIFMATLLSAIPSEAEQEAVAEYEFAARTGKYDDWVNDAVKVTAREKEVLDDPDYHRFLKWIMERFDIKKRANRNGVVRRTMNKERNHRGPEFKFDLSTEKKRFQLIWDCFCWRFRLYGLDLNSMKPLVMKSSITVSGFCTDVSFPRGQSCDVLRDLRITPFGKLHRSDGTKRQGPKVSEGRLDKKEIAKRVYFAELASQEAGLKGDERFRFIIKEARLSPHTEERRINELIVYGRELIHGKKALKPVERIEPKPSGSVRVKYILKLESEMTPEEHKELALARAARKSK